MRLSQGDYSRRRIYDASPVDMAKRYADCGVKRIHVVDLDGAKSSSPKNLKTLAARIDTDKMKKPSFLMVLTGTGRFAFKREDGVLEVPVCCLKD